MRPPLPQRALALPLLNAARAQPLARGLGRISARAQVRLCLAHDVLQIAHRCILRALLGCGHVYGAHHISSEYPGSNVSPAIRRETIRSRFRLMTVCYEYQPDEPVKIICVPLLCYTATNLPN